MLFQIFGDFYTPFGLFFYIPGVVCGGIIAILICIELLVYVVVKVLHFLFYIFCKRCSFNGFSKFSGMEFGNIEMQLLVGEDNTVCQFFFIPAFFGIEIGGYFAIYIYFAPDDGCSEFIRYS